MKLAADVPTLLAQHGISDEETPLTTSGYSGAAFSAVESRGGRWIIKRLRFQRDWIMRHTGDTSYREAEFAVSPLVAQLPDGIRLPTIGAAYDAHGGRALLMRDIAPVLLPDGGVLRAPAVDVVLRRAAEMHAHFWGDPLPDAGVNWTSARVRHSLLSAAIGAALLDEGREFGLVSGWHAFDELAPADAVRLAQRLFGDPSLFLAVLHALPATLLHGDLKFANMGIDGAGRLWLFDWALVARGPAAVDMSWFLAVNSSRLPWNLDETLARYRAHLERELGARFAAAQWERQEHALAVSGLLLYGWGKALDARDGRPDELRWWCDRAVAAARALGL